MPDLIFFPGDSADALLIGGKAAALIKMVQAGVAVPTGAVLTTSFFAPWIASIQASTEWAELLASEPDDWATQADRLRAPCEQLSFSHSQRQTLADLRERLDPGLYAVRSSSPEEDLEGASFAGGYETVLGVPLTQVESALYACFISSLDARVMHYKRKHGFDVSTPRIAVIVQRQIDSTVAGVGFSLNPMTNDYDEAVFDGSWGLGESVVSGAVTPDHFVVNRVSGEVLSKELGAKQSSLHLLVDGGHERRTGHRSEEFCLSTAQLEGLTTAIGQLEMLFGRPIDIEWAFEGTDLTILQARPITTWVPLPRSMKTKPGDKRRLYMDIALSGGLTINAPISPIGQSWMTHFASHLVHTYIGPLPVEFGPGDDLWFLTGGRMYQDLSNVFWLTTPRLLAASMRSKDALMADILANVDGKTYRSARRPSWVSLRMALAYPGALWRARRVLFNAAKAAWNPARAKTSFDIQVQAFETEFADLPDLPIPELIERYAPQVIRHVLEVTMPGLILSLSGLSIVEMVVPTKHAELGARLLRGFEGNVVVEMGAALFEMSRMLEPQDMHDPERLAERLVEGTLPTAFLEAWAAFLDLYGWRGPHEVDLACPRYADDPSLALRQLCMMGESDFDPRTVLTHHIDQRHSAFDELISKLGFFRRFVLKWAHGWIEHFGGTRDTPKHDYLMFFAALRRRAMGEGARLVAEGRLDHAEQVLQLTLEEIDGPDSADLREQARSNTVFLDTLSQVVRAFPCIIDSRGRILRPAPTEQTPGQLDGMAISPGVVRGRVNVLNHPNEKPVRPGDILVAHTTDPGWTPLFVNAAAVVLEVGGMLQHGAVVAREYGKPCVGGISRLLERLEDGQFVEVDGTMGVVRILEEPGDQ